MSKKVGIISFQNANNYGALFQMFALQTAVKKLGKSPEIINYQSQNFDFEKDQLPIFKQFKNKYLNLSREYIGDFTLSADEYETVITGSDQVWNNIITENDENYYLKFVKDENIRKVAYAAGTGGGSDGEDNQRRLLSKYVKDFYRVSLREPIRLSLVKECTGKDAAVTLDPTQLLEEKDYTDIIEIPTPKEKGYILLFKIWPYDRLKDFANLLSLYYDKKIIAVSDFESEYSFVEGSMNYNYPDMENWLSLFKNAGLIVTDSFHGLMFSIIFRRPFYVWAEDGPSAGRIKTILSKLKLEGRFLKESIGLPEINFDIDYSSADENLKSEREASLEFLKEALL